MWKVSGRSSALERAQALLSAKKSSGGGSILDPPTRTQGGSFQTRSVPPKSQTLLSELSDLSSESSAAEHGDEAATPVNTQQHPERKDKSSKDVNPQSPLGEGNRFLKKAPKPANSSHSPVSRNQAQPVVEPRYVSSSQRGSKAPAWRRLAEIESRVRSRKIELEQAKQAAAADLRIASDLETSPAAAFRNADASVELLARSESDQSQRGNRFLKKKKTGAAGSISDAPPEETGQVAVGVRSRSRGGDSDVRSRGSQREPSRVMSAVSLESDEEDMKKLLGDSVGAISMVGPARLSSVTRTHRTPSKKVERPASVAAATAHPSSTPSRSPASPSRRSSPFRFTGQAQVQFSPSVLSLSSSPHCVPSSHPERRGSSQRAESPQRSHSSSSSCAEVLSLEDLFPAEPASEDPHSHMSSVSSEEFKINVMTLDELIPAADGTASGVPKKQNPNKLTDHVPGSDSTHQQLTHEEVEEAVLDYHSDFDSDSSARQISENLGDDDDDDYEKAEVESEVILEVSRTDRSQKKTDDDYCSTFSEPSHSSNSGHSQRPELCSRSGTCSSRSSPQHSRRHASVRRSFKDAVVQTQPDCLADSWSAGVAQLDPTVGRIYMQPTPALLHTISAERLEAISTFNPAVFALNEILKQQLTMTRQFMEHSERLHSCLLRSLEPPNYKYTTLEETMQNICRHRQPKATRRFCRM